jgi:hypothetical protein
MPPGADPRANVVVIADNEAAKEFVTLQEPEEIIAFYREQLVPSGWNVEDEPIFGSFQHPGSLDVYEPVTWSLTKGDIRLMLGAYASPRGTLGEIVWTLRIQPVWYRGWDPGETAPFIPSDTTPIPIGPDSADETGESEY